LNYPYEVPEALTDTGLLTRSMQKMEHQNFGFETDHRVNLSVNAPFKFREPQPEPPKLKAFS
jgi:hypothetical protein